MLVTRVCGAAVVFLIAAVAVKKVAPVIAVFSILQRAAGGIVKIIANFAEVGGFLFGNGIGEPIVFESESLEGAGGDREVDFCLDFEVFADDSIVAVGLYIIIKAMGSRGVVRFMQFRAIRQAVHISFSCGNDDVFKNLGNPNGSVLIPPARRKPLAIFA